MKFLSVIFVGYVLGSQAQAEVEDDHDKRALYTIEQSVMHWSQTTVNSPEGKSSKSSILSTHADDFYFMASWRGINLYLYPHSPEMFSLSYMVEPELEFGIDIDYLQHSGDSDEESHSLYGLWSTYYQQVTSSTLEITVSVSSMKAKSVTEDDSELRSTHITYGIELDYVMPIFSGIYYMGGVSWWNTRLEENQQKSTQDDMGIRLAGFRAEW